jgi:hypothetical protein
LAEISEASKRAPLDAKLAQPSSPSSEAADASPRNRARREGASAGDVVLRDAIS